MIDIERFKEIAPQLKAPFPVSAHKERDLPGGGTWYYVPWQLIRDRLDEIVPDWTVEYTDPILFEDLCVIRCRMTICGIVREAPGNAPVKLMSQSGKDMARGTPVERAIADATKNAAEAFGVCRYLDDQADPATKEAFVRHMRSGGNARAGTHLRGKTEVPKPAAKPFGRAQLISQEQVMRFWTIARRTGYSDEAVKKLIATYQLESTKQITTDIYEALCGKASDADLAAIYLNIAETAKQESWA